jgi:mono/diheme cytochrome c family protein
MKVIIPCLSTLACRSIVVPFVALLALAPNLAKADGAQLYADNCAACHQATGSGIPTAYPALMGQAVVAGDADTVIKIILLGPAKVLPADRPKFSGQMPPITGLSDAKIAALVTYIRDKFGKGASPVTEDEVTKVKASLAQ